MIEVATPSDGFDSDVWRAAVEARVADRSPTAVLVAHSVDGMSFGPAVAATQGLGSATDVVAMARSGDGLVATRAPYGGKVAMTVELPAGSLVQVRGATFPGSRSGRLAAAHDVRVPAPSRRASPTAATSSSRPARSTSRAPR